MNWIVWWNQSTSSNPYDTADMSAPMHLSLAMNPNSLSLPGSTEKKLWLKRSWMEWKTSPQDIRLWVIPETTHTFQTLKNCSKFYSCQVWLQSGTSDNLLPFWVQSGCREPLPGRQLRRHRGKMLELSQQHQVAWLPSFCCKLCKSYAHPGIVASHHGTSWTSMFSYVWTRS